MAILKDQNLAVQLDMIGATSNTVYPQLRELGKRLGIDSVIQWRGLIPYGPELFSYYQRADALVLPSYSEGFPIVIWEAAANCCPVITTNVGGIPELWEDHKHGLLIPPKDVEAVVRAIHQMLGDERLRTEVVENAYQPRV